MAALRGRADSDSDDSDKFDKFKRLCISRFAPLEDPVGGFPGWVPVPPVCFYAEGYWTPAWTPMASCVRHVRFRCRECECCERIAVYCPPGQVLVQLSVCPGCGVERDTRRVTPADGRINAYGDWGGDIHPDSWGVSAFWEDDQVFWEGLTQPTRGHYRRFRTAGRDGLPAVTFVRAEETGTTV